VAGASDRRIKHPFFTAAAEGAKAQVRAILETGLAEIIARATGKKNAE
jgi:hypothetical protein